MNLSDTAHLLHMRGLNASCEGVLAARLAEQDVICITSAKSDFKSIGRQDICLVNLAGKVVPGAPLQRPPDNLNFYLKVFQDRPDIFTLAHVYPPFASAFADQAQLFKISGNPDQSLVRELIKVECRECPSRFTGLCSCRGDIRKSYAGADALLIKEDGIVVLAADLSSLFEKIESIEQSAEMSFTSGSFKLTLPR